jgi:hypothetical protein
MISTKRIVLFAKGDILLRVLSIELRVKGIAGTGAR